MKLYLPALFLHKDFLTSCKILEIMTNYNHGQENVDIAPSTKRPRRFALKNNSKRSISSTVNYTKSNTQASRVTAVDDKNIYNKANYLFITSLTHTEMVLKR